jgi:hypothetical protein
VQLTEVVARDLTRRFSNTALRALAERTAGASECIAVAASEDGKTLVAVTDVGIEIGFEKGPGLGYAYGELHSISILGQFDPALFIPLRRNEPFDAVALAPPDAERLAAAARPRIAAIHEVGSEWWDTPMGTLGIAASLIGLMVKPASSPMPERQWCTVSFVNTGIQIRTARHPKYPSMYKEDVREFLPWPAVQDVSVEGSDQIERRPSVGAVLAFGVMGLGASKTIKRSFLVVAGDQGDYVFERQEMLPLELAGFLAPVLRQMHHAAQQLDPMQQLLDEQRETNRLLNEILSTIRVELPGES